MTVTEIVKDLLEHNMITTEAAAVLLDADLKAKLFDKQNKNVNQVFQPYHGVPNAGTTNPYYISTTTNDPLAGITTTGLSAAANELLKTQ
jgi:hypothetical protein